MFLQSTAPHHNPQMTSNIFCQAFNCRSNSWLYGNISTKESIDLELVSSYHGFHQLITNPAHILPQPSFCIYLIFIEQSNLVIDSGVHLPCIPTAPVKHLTASYLVLSCLKIVFPIHSPSIYSQSGISKKPTILKLEKYQILLTGTLFF